MEPNSPRVVPGSWLHRVLRLKPGDVPWWLCSRHYDGFDLMVPLHLLLLAVVGLMPLLFGISWLWIPSLVLFCLFVSYVTMPFSDRERWGRARSRRGECVWCGQPKVEAGVVCMACGRL